MNDESFLLPPTEVPGFGNRVVPTSRLVPNEEWPYTERGAVETDRFRIELDRERGGIASWTDGAR